MLFQLASLILFSGLLSTSLADDTYYCNETVACPDQYPCCSHTGVCGTGTYCLGGCDPRYSFNLTACVPQPVCQSGNYSLTKGGLIEDTEYLGDSKANRWTYSGYVMDYDDSLLLAMPKQSTGTVISSTFFVWYGKVTTRFKSSHNAGVVSASILFSNVQDEIDVEFIGNALDQPQSNFYFEGVLNYTNEVNMSSSDTFENWHSYEVDWKEDNITWSIDGEVQRILNKEDTYNETTEIYQFPQTPSRIQLSLWAGGDKGNAVGVVEWAGGDIDWNATDFTNPGYLYASLDYVAVECYDPPSGTEEQGNLSYIYTSTKKFTQDTVMITDNDTVIANFGQTGFDISDDDDDAANSTDSQLAHTSESQSSSSGLPSGYSTQFFQNINTAASSSNAAAPGCYCSLGTFFLFAFYLI